MSNNILKCPNCDKEIKEMPKGKHTCRCGEVIKTNGKEQKKLDLSNFENYKARRKSTKILALIATIFVLFIFMLVPMFLFRMIVGISIDGKGPEGEGWLLVIGGGLGAGAGYFVFYFILTRFGGYDEDEVNAMWNRKK